MPTTTDAPAVPVWVEAGEAWSHAAADWAYRFEPYADEAIEAIFGRLGVAEGIELCDVACGGGFALGRAARRGVASAGLDASAGLIEIARRRAPDADLRVGDMFDLPWANASFDVVTSFNGVWGGCQDALVEARRILRAGGGIGLTFWGAGHQLDLRDFFIALGGSLPPVGEEMKSLAAIGAPGVVEAMLDVAGFAAIERWDAPAILEFPDAETAWRTMRSPGLVVPALQHHGDAVMRDVLMDTLEPFRDADGSYRLVNALTCVTATAV